MSGDVTRLLERWREGDSDAAENLMPLVYDELRRLAHARLWGERADHTLSTTALVHEVYLNLADAKRIDWNNRTHFFAVAARVMRNVLIDYARSRNRVKRGGEYNRVTLDEALVVSEERYDDLLALDDALTRLEAFDERSCRIVEARYFGGLSIAETADALGVSPATVKRDWTTAKAWLKRELTDAAPE
ncbi:MAG: sigma-70 family RNA polymerase sigma factor [Bacteroidetes bacterium]|nr:sigma-70 family RNA polymerase sigma factor [Bacteroidota bacterium]